MYLRVMGTQNGNSCAAHCMEISEACVNKGIPRSQGVVEGAMVWGNIQFQPNKALGKAYAELVKNKNTDPRRLLAHAQTRPGCNGAVMLSDTAQRDVAIQKLPTAMQGDALGLYALLTAGATTGTITIESGKFYNCSYAMFAAKLPSPGKFTGYHNMLVVLDGIDINYYNPNEASPTWGKAPKGDWKELVNQNGGTCSYVFTGIAVRVP